jgi:hypothetical protein
VGPEFSLAVLVSAKGQMADNSGLERVTEWSGPRWVTLVCESGDVDGVQLLEFNRGARQRKALWRRCRLWKISKYSKIALASSIRVVHRRRSSSSVCIRAQKDSMTALS